MKPTHRTGIEIRPGISNAQKRTTEILKALHLEWFGAAIQSLAKGATMIITIDGHRSEEPWSADHFFECAPGTHTVELEWNTHSIGGRSLAPLKCEIAVEPSRITEVEYTVQTGLSHGPAA